MKDYSNIYIISIIFIIYLILNFGKETLERFSCLTYSNKIRSLDIEIMLKESIYVYEFPISKMRQIIKDNHINGSNIEVVLERLNEIPEVKRSRSKFKNIYSVNNDYIIYREGKHYGFHVVLSENNNADIKGIIDSYSIISRYVKRKNRSLEEIYFLYKSDPRMANYLDEDFELIKKD